MFRWLAIALAGALALPSAPVSASTLTLPAVVFTGTAPTTCPMGSTYADGCASAQATGSLQYTNFFNGYTNNGAGYPPQGSCSVADPGSGGALRCRPPWNVAGADYPVGYSTAITLATPTSTALKASCPGASYSGNSLTISGSANCTINGFDFTKVSNCASISITDSATVTLSNNNISTSSCTSYSVALNLSGTGNYNILYNQFTGSNPASGGPGGLIAGSGNGWTATIEYNALLNTDQSVVQFAGTNDAEVHYNYAENLGCCGNHGDFQISTSTSGTITFNQSYNTLYGHNATATTECYPSTGGTGGTITGYCNNQTMIANPSDPSKVTVSYMIESSDGTIGNWSANDNYLDINGSYGYYATMTGGQSVVGTITCTGNINMSTGALATGTFTGATCN